MSHFDKGFIIRAVILIGAQEISKTYSSKPLFEGLSFSIESGQRIGLIGPNGAGKTTLLRILSGQIGPDSGKLTVQKGLRIGFLEQVPQFSENASIHSTIMEGVKDPHDWEEMARANEIMAKLDLTKFGEETLVSTLSGGWKKRVALARELTREPDLMLLDEPTNHLDVESILWLEDLLARSNFATLTITHDRLFLQRISNRIIEVDKKHLGGLLSVNGNYADFLAVREEVLSAQERHETKLKNTLRRETEWLRRGAQARQTKQRARMDAAYELEDKVNELNERNQNRTVRLDFISMEKNPKKLVEAKEISKSYSGKQILPPLDLLITPKSRIGLMGPNGCGKSTLIKILTKLEEPDTGKVFHSDRLKISLFEQNRESLDPNKTVLRTLCPAGERVIYAGNEVHIRSYLARFLFAYDQMDATVGKLSGGEQSRLLLARLMLTEANLLILDEPTNDLDMSTLDVLADVLKEFNGAVVLVTHDRYFLDQVTNQIIAFGTDSKGNKTLTSMVGLDQWEIWHQGQEQRTRAVASAAAKQKETAQAPKKKLSYKDQREFDQMEAKIAEAEARLVQLTEESGKSGLSPTRLREIATGMAEIQAEIDMLYARWAELENRT